MTARHSTGVTKPVPAVDGDLLEAIGETAYDLCSRDTGTYEDDAKTLLASEPMQRLRAAWTAETARERDEWHREADLRSVQEERTIYRAEKAERERDEARAEVERLRAAVPDLPNVGPVKHEGSFYDVGSMSWLDGEDYAKQERTYLHRLACVRAIRAHREAEERAAADTTTDEFPDETLFTGHLRCKGRYGPDGLRCGGGLGHASYSACGPGIALDDFYAAHRARTHGKDAQ